MPYDLEFERPLADIDKRIQALQRRGDRLRPDERTQLDGLRSQLDQRAREIYRNLTPTQRVQVARHKNRPYTADYINLISEDFFELHGDRRYGDDHAIMGGLASIDGKTIMLIGNQKGRDTKDRLERNFGMAHAEGYRKAQRLMRQAEQFHMPVVTLIDISGAALDLEAEQRGIAQAIAESLFVMAALRTPIVSIVIGEGGSGGALSTSVADRILMLENTIYTVASPEAAASILWRDSSHAPKAAAAMKITAQELLKLKLIEEIIPEPAGGAHQDYAAAAASVKSAIIRHIGELEQLPTDQLLDQRYQRFRAIGVYKHESVGATSPTT